MNVDNLNDEACRRILKKLVEELDELDGEDYFGTEGWEHRFGFEFD
jgi:hypothetical protein